MERVKKIVMFCSLGVLYSFWIIAIIHLNSYLFEPYFMCATWHNIVTTSLISGAPLGLAIWAFLISNFSSNTVNCKFIFKLLKRYLVYYFVGIILAFFLILGIHFYLSMFYSNDGYAIYYKLVEFSVLLGLPMAMIIYNIKMLIWGSDIILMDN